MKNGAFLYHGTQQDVRSSTEESKDGDTIKTMTAWQSPETPDNGGELLFQRAVRRLQEASRVDRFRETGNRTVGVRGSVGGEAGGIESLSLGRWRVLAIVCTMTWVYLTLLNRILKIMRMVNFMLRVFSTIKKGKKESDRPTWHIMKDRRGDIHGASRSGHFHTGASCDHKKPSRKCASHLTNEEMQEITGTGHSARNQESQDLQNRFASPTLLHFDCLSSSGYSKKKKVYTASFFCYYFSSKYLVI